MARHLGLEKLNKVAINVTCASFSMHSFIHFIWSGVNVHNREHTYLSIGLFADDFVVLLSDCGCHIFDYGFTASVCIMHIE